MYPEFVDSLPLLSREEIDLIEGMLGFSFPNEYRHFLMTINGGFVEPYYFEPDERFIVVDYFSGISLMEPDLLSDSQKIINLLELCAPSLDDSGYKLGEHNSYEVFFKNHGYNRVPGMPENLFIIGADDAGNSILMSMFGGDKGGQVRGFIIISMTILITGTIRGILFIALCLILFL